MRSADRLRRVARSVCRRAAESRRFPTKELDRLRGQTLATIQQEKAQPAAMINRVMPALLFGEGHAYSTSVLGHRH